MTYQPDPERYDKGVKFRRCGNSGILLPEISLGFWRNFGSIDDYEKCRDIARYAFDNGVVHFDLANNYGPPYGSAEETLGRMMDDTFRPYRDELFISSKAGYDMWPGPYGDWGSRKYLMNSLNQSLKRMKLDYLDLFYSHRFDPNTPVEETLQALVDMVKMGKVLYVGISRWPLKELKIAIEYLKAHDVPLLIYQGKLNLLYMEPIESGLLEECRKNGVGFIGFSPLAQGILTDKYLNNIPKDSRIGRGLCSESELTPEVLAKLRRLNEDAHNKGQTLATEALNWVLAQEGVTSVIVGVSRKEQLHDNIYR